MSPRQLAARKRADLAIVERLATRGASMQVVATLEHAILTGEFTFDGIRDSIEHAMARAAYTDWWISEQELKREHTGKPLPWGPGERIDDYVPTRTPATAKKWAKEAIQQWESESGMPIEMLYWLAANAEGRHRREPTSEDFGYLLAMQTMGHGIGWSDDHPDFEPMRGIHIWHPYYP